MKQFLTLVILTGIVTVVAAKDAVVAGSGEVLKEGMKIMLFRQFGQSGTVIASDSVSDGRFRIAVPLDSGVMETSLMVYAPGFPSMDRTIFLRPRAEVEINAPDCMIKTWPVVSNVPEQERYDRYLMNSKDLWDCLQNEYMAFDNALSKASGIQMRDSVINAYEAGESLRDSIDRAIFLRDLSLLREDWVDDIWWHKAEEMARTYHGLKNEGKPCPVDFKIFYEGLDENLRNTIQGQKINALLNPPATIGIGGKVPGNIFYDLSGKEHRLSDLQGKWLLIDIWSRGCYACVKALPELKAFAENNAAKVEVVSLSIDQDEMWRKFSEKNDMGWNNWNEGKEDLGVYQDFGAKGTPTFIFVSPEGIVMGISFGFSEGMFERLLKLYSTPRNSRKSETKDGGVIIEYPEYGDNQTYGILDIVNIERNVDNTKIKINVTYNPGEWITISGKSYIATPDGRKFKLTGSEGITPGEKYHADEKGSGSFSLIFEPLPNDVSEISFNEGEEGEWKIESIKLH